MGPSGAMAARGARRIDEETMPFREYEQATIPEDEREACTRSSRSSLSAMPHFVSVSGLTSDNGHYGSLYSSIRPRRALTGLLWLALFASDRHRVWKQST